MTTTLFDFLKNFNPEAYEIAMQIEDEVTTSPASIKTYATTFLECIVDDMLLKSGNKNINPMANFTPKVKKLSLFGVIKYSFETQLINAYKLRNTAHYSLKKTADEDRRIALELYEKLFHIAWRYFQEFGGNEYNYLGKPKFIPPFRENEDRELVEVPNIERMEKLYDHCIICGRKNNSRYHNLCSDCNNKIEHVEDVINLKNHFDGDFTKRNVVDIGYSKPYSDALIRELLNENLIIKSDKSYSFNDDYFKKYLDEIEMYGEIELVLSEFASGKLSLKDIKNTDYYRLGGKSVKPYTQLYRIVNDAVFKEFLSQLDLGIEIDDIMADTTITVDEIHGWYFNQLKLLEDGIKTKEFINYNKILIDSFIKLKASGENQKEITRHLHLPDNIVDFWLNTHIKEFDYFKTELDNTIIDLILKKISEDKTMSEILTEVDITGDEFSRLLDEYGDFSDIYKRRYIDKRRKDFLYYLNEKSFKTSYVDAHLELDELNMWLGEGERDFELKHDTELADFYRKTIEKEMKHYIRYRLNGISKTDSADKINQSPKTIESWLRRDDFEIFTDFQKQYADIKVSVAVNAIKKGSSLSEAAVLADMSLKSLKNLIESKDSELYEVYEKIYIPNQLNIFLDKLKSSKYKKALKASGLSEDELNRFYIKGLEGDIRFKDFVDEYFEYKLNIYKKEIVNKGKSPSKASRNANFLDEDFKYRQSDIDRTILQNKIKVLIPQVKKATPLKIIADKSKMDVDELFDWYIRGYNGDETFKEFSECYWEYRMSHTVFDFQSFFDNGISEEFFLNYILNKEIIPEYNFYKDLDLFTYSDKDLSLEKQVEISTLITLENAGIIDEVDEDLDISEIIEDYDEIHINKFIKKFKKNYNIDD